MYNAELLELDRVARVLLKLTATTTRNLEECMRIKTNIVRQKCGWQLTYRQLSLGV